MGNHGQTENRDLYEKQTGRHVKLRKDTENNRQGVSKLHFSMQQKEWKKVICN